MNIRSLKALTWLGAVGVAGLLAWEVVDFLRRKPELEKQVPEEELAEVLQGFEAPAEPRRNLVDYAHVRAVFLDMDWTGTPPVEKPRLTGPADEGVKRPAIPVARLLTVLALQVDETDPAGSRVYVHYTDAKLVALNRKPEARFLKIGDRLPAPYADARVDAITPEGVRFVFDDAEREAELVEFPSEPSGIVQLGEGEKAAIFRPERRIGSGGGGTAAPFRPKKTVQYGKNEFQIGTETAAEVDRDFTRILSRDVGYRTARDPRTNAIKGIQITDVAPNSIPAQHGLSPGEIVISINGHRVTSVNDAVAYVKQEAKTTNTWNVVFEKQGKQFTRTYKSPVN